MHFVKIFESIHQIINLKELEYNFIQPILHYEY